MNTTQTNLMNEILEQYLHWARFIINHDSPFLTFDSGTIMHLIEGVPDEQLERLVKEVLNEASLDFIKFRWREVNLQNMVKYLDLLSSYANVGNITVHRSNSMNGKANGGVKNSERSSYQISVRHHFGKRWSTLLALHISTLIMSSVPGVTLDFEVSNKSCFVHLNLNGKQ